MHPARAFLRPSHIRRQSLRRAQKSLRDLPGSRAEMDGSAEMNCGWWDGGRRFRWLSGGSLWEGGVARPVPGRFCFWEVGRAGALPTSVGSSGDMRTGALRASRPVKRAGGIAEERWQGRRATWPVKRAGSLTGDDVPLCVAACSHRRSRRGQKAVRDIYLPTG